MPTRAKVPHHEGDTSAASAGRDEAHHEGASDDELRTQEERDAKRKAAGKGSASAGSARKKWSCFDKSCSERSVRVCVSCVWVVSLGAEVAR